MQPPLELSRDKKLTTYTQTDGRTDGRTDGQTDGRTDGRTETHTYIFGKRLYFQLRPYMNNENGEI